MAEKSAAEEVIDAVNEHANSEEQEPETPAAEPESGNPDPQKAAEPSSIDLDGETFTLDQIRDFRKSGLMQEDYTRKTMALSEERKAMEAERQAMREILGRYDSVLKGLTGQAAERTDPNDPSVTPTVRSLLEERDQILAEAMEQLKAIREREEEREETRIAGFIVQTADEQIRHLMKEAKVPDEWFDIYRDRIGNRDPDCADPISGQLTKQSIASAIRKEFGVVHQSLAKLQAAPTSTALKGLKPEPKARPVVTATPKPDESAQGARRKDAFDGARDEVMDAIAAAARHGA